MKMLNNLLGGGLKDVLSGAESIIDKFKLRPADSKEAPCSAVASPLTKGTVVKVLAEQSGWSKVQLQTEGWVKSEWLKSK